MQPSQRVIQALVALLAGLLFALLCLHWFSRFYLGGPFSVSDFQDYCVGVHALREGLPELSPPRRSRLVAWVPAMLGGGIQTGLARGAFVGTWAVGCGLWVWARSLGGWPSAVAALLCAFAVAPVALQVRLHSFYPVMDGLLVLGAGAVALGVWRREVVWIGLAAAVALLVDVRGLLWALPWLAIGLLLCLRGGPIQTLKNLAALLLPLLISYAVAQWAFPEFALSLEEQLHAGTLMDARAQGHQTQDLTPEVPVRFLWGHTPLSDIPATLRFLLSNHSESDLSGAADQQMVLGQHLKPMWVWFPALLGLPFWAGWRDRRALALVASCLPFMVALWAGVGGLELRIRFLAQALSFLPILLAISLTPRPGRARWLVLPLLALVVFGVIPTPASPDARWRVPVAPNTVDVQRVAHPDAYAQRIPQYAQCRAALVAGGELAE